MDMKVLKDLEEKLEKELKKIAEKSDISPAELENATKAVCLIEKLRDMESGGEDAERSYGSYGRHPDYRYHDDRMDYGRGRSSVTGRYISTGYDGYSGHSISDRMVAKLEEMYDQAKTEHERETVDKWIKRLETER